MSRFIFVLVVLSVVACSVAQQDVQVVPLEAADAGVPVNPALVAGDARPKRQFGLGFLLGSALSSGYGYGYPYRYGGYGYGHGHSHGLYHHHGYRRPPNYGYYGSGYGYGR
ncbi:hypothetical protein GHT06_012270 [Daphnia sinensis]|uniref:Uncharacterized protein n=1 Tax=Daphnia sinensis TaxID=1820382 RepID=A0AAD5PYN9_9CRUS|nr:hypothetical protein GHT06_012270 [Daphnia sinensis]